MKRSLVIGIMYTMLFLIGNIHLHADERTNVKEITSLEEPTWIFQTGISKGKYHDRQDLEFILQRNTPLKVRQTNPNFKDKLTLRLLSNDSKKEKSIQVGSEWVTIQGDNPLVPFIDTPYGEERAILEYQVGSESATKPLPIYKQQGSS